MPAKCNNCKYARFSPTSYQGQCLRICKYTLRGAWCPLWEEGVERDYEQEALAEDKTVAREKLPANERKLKRAARDRKRYRQRKATKTHPDDLLYHRMIDDLHHPCNGCEHLDVFEGIRTIRKCKANGYRWTGRMDECPLGKWRKQ